MHICTIADSPKVDCPQPEGSCVGCKYWKPTSEKISVMPSVEYAIVQLRKARLKDNNTMGTRDYREGRLDGITECIDLLGDVLREKEDSDIQSPVIELLDLTFPWDEKDQIDVMRKINEIIQSIQR